jgi:hypothetical protein
LAWLADVGGNPALAQYASSDLGNHFQQIGVIGASSPSSPFADDPGLTFDLAPVETGGFVAAVSGVVSGRVHALTLASAYTSIVDGTTVEVDASATRALVARDESGSLLMLAGATSAAGTLWRAYGSTDGGASWSAYYQGQSANARGATLNTLGVVMEADPALALGRGRGHLAHRWTVSSYSWGASLGMAYLGGWASPTQPLARQSDSDFDSVGWYATILPATLPNDYDNVATVSATATISYLSGATTAVATLGQNAHYRFDLATVTADNRVTAWRLVGRVSSGSTLAAMRAGM